MPMDRDRWIHVEELFNQALAVDGAARDALLRSACGDDAELRAAVENLLRAHGTDVPLLDAGPEVLFALLDDDAAAPPFERIGPFRIIRELGRGGMGVVYLAERDDDDFRQRVALKCVLPGVATPDLVERFRRERRILASLVHPNIAQLHDGGVAPGGAPYFVMEFVEGDPIDRYCDRLELDIEARLSLFATVCDAVQYAHQHLVVHRDLKPGNILVSAHAQVKLLDFGIAKLLEQDDVTESALTRTARVLTPEYSSPEQVRGEPVTAASDVFSLGLILFELLTGRRALASPRGQLERMREVLDTDVPRASAVVELDATSSESSNTRTLPSAALRASARGLTPERLRRRLRGDLDTIVERALRRDPAERYASAQALVDDVRRHLAGEPILARPASTLYRASKFVRRHRIGVVATAAVLLALVAGLGAALWQGSIAARERDVARAEAAKAERVTEFLVGVFRSADPSESLGANLTAREILERGTRRIDAELSAEPVIQASVRRAIGQIYANLSEFPQARTLIERSLEQHRAALTPDHPEVADDLHALASLARDAGSRLGLSSDSLYIRVIELHRRNLGPHHPKVGDALRGLANGLVVSDTIAADSLLRQALGIYERNPGHERQLAQALNDLGLFNHSKGHYPEAERYYREALTLARRAVGDDHPSTLVTLNNLGNLLQLVGRLHAADSMLQQTLVTRRRVLGERHERVARTLHALGEVAHRRGDYDAAERYFHEALDIRREKLGPTSLSIADNLQMLAAVATARGHYDEADAKYREAIQILERGENRNGPGMARTLSNYGGLFQQRGDYAAATRYYRRAWQIYRERAGDAHAFTAIVQGNLGSTLLLQDSLAAAEPLLRNAADVLRKSYSDTHTSVGVVMIDIGSIELRRGALSAAEQTLRRAVDILEAGMPAGSWRIAQAKLRLGRCIHALRRFDEAERLLLDALVVFEPIRAQRRRDYAEALTALEQLYRAWGRPADARRYAAMRAA